MSDKNIQTKVQELLNKVPSPRTYGGTGGNFRINHEKKVVEFNFDWPREARHPDEYGAFGRKAEKKMDEYDSLFYTTILKPLEALGYKHDSWAW
jgi:hypothetical protein